MKKASPNIPNKIEGVAPIESKKKTITFLIILFFAYSLSQIAINKDNGKLITIVTMIKSNVLMTACPVVSAEY
ncbi:hypothetical protein IKD48_02670 [bacterium]|nr:hypothetical protein [bacterium]MBR2652259.1 hypothetical protein [bacterium]